MLGLLLQQPFVTPTRQTLLCVEVQAAVTQGMQRRAIYEEIQRTLVHKLQLALCCSWMQELGELSARQTLLLHQIRMGMLGVVKSDEVSVCEDSCGHHATQLLQYIMQLQAQVSRPFRQPSCLHGAAGRCANACKAVIEQLLGAAQPLGC